MLGVKKPANQNEYVGQSGRGDKLVDQHFPKQDGENVLIQARGGGHATDASVRRAVRDVVTAVGASAARRRRQVALRRRQREPGLQGRPLRPRDLRRHAATTSPPRRRSTRSRRPSKDAGARQPGGVRRPVRRRQREQGAVEVLPGRLQEGRDALAADHADHPRARLRRAGRRRHPAAAGPDRRHGDARPDRDPEPDRPDGRHDQLDRAARRPGRRRRLHALLPAPRARGARRAAPGSSRPSHIAAATSGRAVLVSGFTVMAAMAGMFLAGGRTFTALGVGAIMVVAVAMIGSVTVVPGRPGRAGRPRRQGPHPVPVQGPAPPRTARAARGTRCSAPSCAARPSPRASPLAVLVGLAIPAFSMHTALTGTNDLPRKLEVMRVYDRMQAAFPGGQIPGVVVIEAKDVRTPQIAAAVKDLEAKATATGHMNGPVTVTASPDRHVATIAVPMDGDGTDPTSAAALADLRGGIVPDTVGAAPGVKHAFVSGMAAGTEDYNALTKSRAPIVFAFVLTPGVPAAAGHVPLDRDPDQGDRAEPAVGRRGLRRHDLGLPGRAPAARAGLQVQRRDRQLAADVPVRDPVRPVDGLPRVHHQPDPRGGRPRHEHRRRGRPRHQGRRRRP